MFISSNFYYILLYIFDFLIKNCYFRQTVNFFGRKLTKKQTEFADMCIDKEVDDVIAKINFFKQNGINEQTAKEVANLLSDEKLNKIRTQEQQKRLNLALNGLLQVMSKKQQEKQVS